MKATTTNRNHEDNRITKWAIGALVIAAILLIVLLRSCSAGNNAEYHMVLNGDSQIDLALNELFNDPGVTFYDQDNNKVTEQKQSELEEKMTIIDDLDVTVPGDYTIIYQYESQSLERMITVLGEKVEQTPDNNGNKDDETTQPNDNNQDPEETTNPGTTVTPGTTTKPGGTTPPSDDTDNTDNTGTTPTPAPGGDDDERGVYYLPSNVKFYNVTTTYDGREHSTTVQNLPYGIRAVYYNNSAVDAGRYDSQVVFVLTEAMKTRYSSVEPASMNAILTINKATPSYVVPTDLTATVGDTLANVKLPNGFSFEKSLNTSVGPEGMNTFLVTFTPADTNNYKVVQHIEVQIKVKPKSGGGEDDDKVVYNLPSNVTFEDMTVTYNGRTYTITVKNLPSGINVRYVNNSGITAGTYNATAYFSLGEELQKTCSSVNPSSMSATLIINKAVPSYTVPTGLTAKVGQTLANVTLPKGFTFKDPLTTSVGTIGSHVFKVTYTPDDTVNYLVVNDIDVIINVTGTPNPDKPVYKLPSNVTFNNLTETYTGTEFSITANNVPEGIIATYSNASRTDSGTQTAKVVFSLSEAMMQSYSGVEPSSMSATLTINPATPSYTVPSGLMATEGQTLADVKDQLSEGFSFEAPLTTSVGTVGDHEFSVTYTPDSTNYKTVTGIKVTIHVTAKPDPTKPKYELPMNVTFNDRTETYTGSEYTITVTNLPFGIIPIYSNNARTNAGSQTATVRFLLNDEFLQSYSGVQPAQMTATLKIDPADPTYTVPTGLTATEGQTLADVKAQLSKGFSFEAPLTTSVGTVGDHEFTVTYTPDSTNYKTVTGIKVTIHVIAKPDPTKPKYELPANVTFSDRTETYTGSEYTITVANLPTGITPIYSNNARTNAGSQTATVTFSLSDELLQSYSGVQPAQMTATLKIDPADPTYIVPTGLTATEGQTLADVVSQLGKGFSFEAGLTTSVGTVGDHEFSVTYTPDSTNYKTVTGIKVTIHVSSRKTTYLLPSNVSFPDVEGIYGEQAVFEALVVNLPDHIVATNYTDNTRSDAGTQTAKVEFSIKPEFADTYSGVSPSEMTATITVHHATPSYTTPTGLTATEGQTLADVVSQLGAGFSFEADLGTSVGRPGTNTFTVKYEPTDKNYKTVTGIAVQITVIAVYELPENVVFDSIRETYNGTEYTILAENLPSFIEPVYTDNKRTNAGDQIAQVRFTFKEGTPEAEMYAGIVPETMTADLVIDKADLSVTFDNDNASFVYRDDYEGDYGIYVEEVEGITVESYEVNGVTEDIDYTCSDVGDYTVIANLALDPDIYGSPDNYNTTVEAHFSIDYGADFALSTIPDDEKVVVLLSLTKVHPAIGVGALNADIFYDDDLLELDSFEPYSGWCDVEWEGYGGLMTYTPNFLEEDWRLATGGENIFKVTFTLKEGETGGGQTLITLSNLGATGAYRGEPEDFFEIAPASDEISVWADVPEVEAEEEIEEEEEEETEDSEEENEDAQNLENQNETSTSDDQKQEETSTTDEQKQEETSTAEEQKEEETSTLEEQKQEETSEDSEEAEEVEKKSVDANSDTSEPVAQTPEEKQKEFLKKDTINDGDDGDAESLSDEVGNNAENSSDNGEQ